MRRQGPSTARWPRCSRDDDAGTVLRAWLPASSSIRAKELDDRVDHLGLDALRASSADAERRTSGSVVFGSRTRPRGLPRDDIVGGGIVRGDAVARLFQVMLADQHVVERAVAGVL